MKEITPKFQYEIKKINITDKNIDLNITFRLSDKCNLSCEYCRWHDGDNYDDPIKCIEVLYDFFKKKKLKTVLFYFHGGEPTIHPKLKEVLEFLRLKESQYNIRTVIEVQTNLTSKLSVLKDVLNLADEISISYHHNDLIKHNKHKIFMANFNYLRENNIRIDKMDIMLENVVNIQEFYSNVIDLISYKNITHSEMIHSFCHYDKNPDTKEKHLQFYNKHNKSEQLFIIDGIEYNTNDLFERGLNCKGMMCNAGQTEFVVNADGNVFHCGIEMTYYRMGCVPVKPITNLVTDKNAINILNIKSSIPTICKYDYCGGDFYIEKGFS